MVGQQLGQRSNMLEERVLYMEQRLSAAERTAAEVSRSYDIQNQRLVGMGADLSRSGAELNDLRMRYEGAVAGNSALQQQVGCG